MTTTRYVCPFLGCGWYLEDDGPDFSQRVSVQHAWGMSWDERSRAATAAVYEQSKQIQLEHAEAIERDLKTHLNAKHPGWTEETLLEAVDAYNAEMRRRQEWSGDVIDGHVVHKPKELEA